MASKVPTQRAAIAFVVLWTVAMIGNLAVGVSHGYTVAEVPIEFVERMRGDSKMSGSVASESLKRITAWGLRERRDQLRRVRSR